MDAVANYLTHRDTIDRLLERIEASEFRNFAHTTNERLERVATREGINPELAEVARLTLGVRMLISGRDS